MTTGVIYRAYNKVTGKSYIGQTIQPLEKRIAAHYASAKKNKYNYFHNALKYWPLDNWEWTILEECPKNFLNRKEIDWICTYNSFKAGYNATEGGTFRGKKKYYKKRNN